MGAYTNAQIEMAQAAAGHVPATGAHRNALQIMTQTALKLIEQIALERAGICDGAGVWVGNDPIATLADDLAHMAHNRTTMQA